MKVFNKECINSLIEQSKLNNTIEHIAMRAVTFRSTIWDFENILKIDMSSFDYKNTKYMYTTITYLVAYGYYKPSRKGNEIVELNTVQLSQKELDVLESLRALCLKKLQEYELDKNSDYYLKDYVCVDIKKDVPNKDVFNTLITKASKGECTETELHILMYGIENDNITCLLVSDICSALTTSLALGYVIKDKITKEFVRSNIGEELENAIMQVLYAGEFLSRFKFKCKPKLIAN